MTFYQKITLLALKAKLGRISTIQTAMHIFGWKSREAIDNVASLRNCLLVDGRILEHLPGNTFSFHTADRTTFVTVSYLEHIDPELRAEIKEGIATLLERKKRECPN